MTAHLRSAWHWWVRVIWRPWVVEVTVAQVLIASAVLFVADRLYLRVGGAHIDGGLFDEPAHIATALLILNLAPRRWRDPILPWALPASFLIDADHVPQYVFGTHVLDDGLQRPITHSLASVALALVIALAWPRARVAGIGIAVGLLLHFMRDCAEDSHTGVALLWPLNRHEFVYHQNVYLLVMAVIAILNLIRAGTLRAWVPARLAPPAGG